MRERGFTILELLVSLTGFAVLLGVVGFSMVTDSQAHESMVARMGPEMKVRSVLHLVLADLRMAGEWGEDRNHNGFLDSGEDTNENGVLDADWNLPDGETRAELVFNRRADLHDEDGNMVSAGVYTAKIRYYAKDGTLFREVYAYDMAGNPKPTRSVLATRVESVRFRRDAGVVRAQVVVTIPRPGGTVERRTLEAGTWLRN